MFAPLATVYPADEPQVVEASERALEAARKRKGPRYGHTARNRAGNGLVATAEKAEHGGLAGDVLSDDTAFFARRDYESHINLNEHPAMQCRIRREELGEEEEDISRGRSS